MITQKQLNCKNPIEIVKNLKKAAASDAYRNAESVLAQVYIEAWDPKFIEGVLRTVQKAMPKAVVAGMTNINHETFTFEEIFDEMGCAKRGLPDVIINLMMFEQSTLCVHAFDCSTQSEFVAGGYMGQLLSEEKDAKAVLLLAAGYEIATESYLAMATAANGSIPFFGATAAVMQRMARYIGADFWVRNPDSNRQLTGYVFYVKDGKPQLLPRGFVNVVFKGEDLHALSSYNFGWTPIGKPMRIDEMEGDRVVKRIDGQPASYIYKKYLGLRPDQLVSENVCEFPFAIKRGSRYLARLGFKVEGDASALAFSSPVFEGDVLRLSYGNPDEIFTESSIRAEEFLEFQTQALLTSACMNRSVLLKEDVAIERDMYRAAAPEMLVLHGNGEILFDAEGGGELASTLAALALREGDRQEDSTAAQDFCRACPYRTNRSVPLVHRLLTFLSATSGELQDALYEAKEANKAKSMFLSSISHEIRTPINAVLGFDEMILRESKDKDIRRYALDIQNSGRTLLSLINDLLDSSRIEAGKMELVPVEYDLASLLNDLVNMTAVRADEKRLKLEVNVEEDIPHLLFGDDTRLKQCVLNILTNAVKYTREGTVTLDVKNEWQDDERVGISFSVTDTGIGIKEEDIPHLFNAYERIDEAKNHGIEGTGLGMNIVTSILAMMGSELKVESTYGVGSRFYFTVAQEVRSTEPIGNFTEMYERSLETAENYREAFHAPSARILVVDDTRMNLTVFRGLLRETQVAIDTAESGMEALALVDKKRYDMIFLDQRMPEMDGIETLKRMQNLCLCNDLNRKTPVIMLTADAVAGARERFLEAGFDDYLSKPVNGKKLEKMLLNYLPKEKVIAVSEDDGSSGAGGGVGGASSAKAGADGFDATAVSGRYADSPFLSALSGIGGLDVKEALANCMEEAILRETVGDFVLGAKTVPAMIEADAAAEDWKNYTIRVHALKSSARIIGAKDLSEQAAYLESCGDAQNAEEINAKTGQLLKDYRSLGEALAAALEAGDEKPGESGGSPEETVGNRSGGMPENGRKGESSDVVLREGADAIGKEEFAAAVTGVRELVEAFDYDGAGDILAMLSEYALSDAQKAAYDKLNIAVRRLDRDAVLAVGTGF